MKEISLPCGKVATVDDEDWPRVSELSWSDRGGGYVRARFKKSAGGDGGFVYLHRFVMAAPKGMVVDHIDRNPLNNRRENLQITTQSRNLMRTNRAHRGGVQREGLRFRARIHVDGRFVSLGMFDTEAEAREMADAAKEIAWSEMNELGTVR